MAYLPKREVALPTKQIKVFSDVEVDVARQITKPEMPDEGRRKVLVERSADEQIVSHVDINLAAACGRNEVAYLCETQEIIASVDIHIVTRSQRNVAGCCCAQMSDCR